jgi:hypothetical protein
MAKLTARSLINEIENLDHGPRAKRIGEVATTTPPQELISVCEALRAFGDFGAQTAIAIARHAKLATLLLSFLAHPSEFVRRHAIRSLSAIELSDVQLHEVFVGAAHAHRPIIVALMRSQGRVFAARSIIESSAESDRSVAQLLTACEQPYVHVVLPNVAHAIVSWGPMARAHPDVVLDFMRSELQATPRSQQSSTLMRWSSALPTLAIRRPKELLAIFANLPDAPGHLLTNVLPHLIRVAPAESAAYIGSLTDLRRTINARPVRRCLRLLREQPTSSTDQRPVLHTVARRLANDHSLLAQLLFALPPSEREELLAEAFADRSTDQLALDDILLEALPIDLRAAHARRMLTLRTVAADPDWALRITSFLPFAEAWTSLEAASKRSDADQRGVGYQRMIFCAAISRDHEALTTTLRHLTRLKNDQDPVRLQAMAMLYRVPATKYRNEHAESLEAIAECIIDARDTSYSTRSTLQQGLLNVLTVAAPEPTSALFISTLRSLVRLAGRDGSIALPLLEQKLRKHHVDPFVNALMPLAKARAKNDQELLTISIARSLGRLGWQHQALQELLRTIAISGTVAAASSGVDLYLANPTTRGERASDLVRRDESYLNLAAISAVANRDRQQLLEPLISGQVLKGRFGSKRKVATAPLFRGMFHRWSPKQIATYGELVAKLVSSTGTSAWERSSAIATLAALPEVASAHINNELGRDTADVPRTEAAIAALANSDRPQLGVPTLLQYAGTDRARVAIYALGKAVRRSLPADTGQPLADLANDQSAKITSRKEAIRLLGSLRSPVADNTLAQLVAAAQLHKDLRIALVWSAMGNAQAAWFVPAIRALRGGGVDEQQALLHLHPFGVPALRHTEVASEITALAQSTDMAIRERAYRSLGNWVRWSPNVVQIGIDAVQDLNEPLWSPAAAFLAELVADRAVDDARIDALVVSLSTRLHEEVMGERDLPAIQRLNRFALFLANRPWPRRQSYAQSLESAARRYNEIGPLAHSAISLAAAAIDWSKEFDLLGFSQTFANSMLLASHAASCLTDSLIDQIDAATWSASATFTGMQRGLVSTRNADRYIAVHLISAVGSRIGWPDAWRALLVTARNDVDADISRIAQATFFVTE